MSEAPERASLRLEAEGACTAEAAPFERRHRPPSRITGWKDDGAILARIGLLKHDTWLAERAANVTQSAALGSITVLISSAWMQFDQPRTVGQRICLKSRSEAAAAASMRCLLLLLLATQTGAFFGVCPTSLFAPRRLRGGGPMAALECPTIERESDPCFPAKSALASPET